MSIIKVNRIKKRLTSGYNVEVSYKPFVHVVIDEFLPAEVANKIAKTFPAPDSSIWYSYDNKLEKKQAQHDARVIPTYINQILQELNSEPFIGLLEELTMVENLIPDPKFNGGGMHSMPKGHKLDVHADYSHHIDTGLKRKVNLIYYCNPRWQDDWGGDLEVWDESVTKLVTTIKPKFNRAVIFITQSDNDVDSMHGVPDSIKCPDNETRQSLALYYYVNEFKEQAIARRRGTRFVARPQDDKSQEIELLRVKRQKGRI